MTKVKVKDKYFRYGGINYFRAQAEEIALGIYGEKKTPFNMPNYLEVEGSIPLPEIATVHSTIVEIDISKMTKTDFEGSGQARVIDASGEIGGELSFEKMRTQELKLVKLSIKNGDMKRAVNDSSEAVEELKSYGKSARIAHQVFVVMEATLAKKINDQGSVGLSFGKGVLQAILGGGQTSSGETKVVISAQTTFAYLLAKVNWDDKKTKVTGLDNDQWGIN